MSFPLPIRVAASVLLFVSNSAFLIAAAPDTSQDVPRFYIGAYDVQGSKVLSQEEIEEAVYPYLGEMRTEGEVEKARLALEKVYHEKGFQAASVRVPAQDGRSGVVVLEVSEGVVGQLRVRGAKYSLPSSIKREAGSVGEGKVINFNELTREVMGLNLQRDRRVTPSLSGGREAGTVDVTLTVEDKLPLHGSLELNNRYSAGTTPLRLNGAVSYSNLWQLGHTVGLSFQLAPQDVGEVNVFSGYYLAPVPRVDWLSFMLQGTKQDSNVSTLGGTAVAGRGDTIGLRSMMTLPTPKAPDLYHVFSLGMDYKHYEQDINLAGTTINTPITYYPFVAEYNATLAGKGRLTALNLSLNFHLRGMGSGGEVFDAKRFKADGNYIYLRAEGSHTQELPWKTQFFGKVQGQLANEPLVDNEQLSGGGLNTVRGYLESEVLGDNAILGTLELRSPSLSEWLGKKVNDWRFYLFWDCGLLTLNQGLPEQEDKFELASYGVGSRVRFLEHWNGSLDVGFPMVDQNPTEAGDVLLTFQVSGDF